MLQATYRKQQHVFQNCSTFGPRHNYAFIEPVTLFYVLLETFWTPPHPHLWRISKVKMEAQHSIHSLSLSALWREIFTFNPYPANVEYRVSP